MYPGAPGARGDRGPAGPQGPPGPVPNKVVCKTRNGGCGYPVGNKPNYYFDRVAGYCAADEYMNGYKFKRCGRGGMGLYMEMKCCKKEV